MPKKNKEIPKAKISEKLMRNMGISKKSKMGQITFVVPSNLAEKLKEQFNFSFDMLNIGGDLPLPELAVHLDEQSTMEGYIGTLVENARYELQLAEDEYDVWYHDKFYKVKEKLKDEYTGKTNITDKYVESVLKSKYKNSYMKRKKKIAKLQYTYRLLNNAIFASIITKGKMMQSLRNVLQGGNQFGLGFETENTPTVKI